VTLQALVASTDGKTILRESATGPLDEADTLGIQVAERLLERGAGDLLTQ
jgi:hydroxymethylbilane synthase